jgi:hypothetical protein
MIFSWNSPVEFEDLDAISAMLRKSPSIVSALDDFRSGQWEELFFEHFEHGTEFYAHLDANVLSCLLRLFSSAERTHQTRIAAALMCLAVTFEIKVNPTFATHEYAFTGADAPDPRLAGFYFIDNLHPQVLADIALGRQTDAPFPPLCDLPETKHNGTHKQHLRMRGLAYASLLKIVELHRCDGANGQEGSVIARSKRAESLLDWMYHDFLFCNAPLALADQLWGDRRRKTVLKGLNTCSVGIELTICNNAAWDIVLLENWAESESKRKPGDPIHLVFTFDCALRELAGQLLVKPNERSLTKAEAIRRRYRQSWPESIAESLATRYLRYEASLECPSRRWNGVSPPRTKGFIQSLELGLREKLGQ